MGATEKTEWLIARQNGIGGSDIGAIMGVSPFKTAVDVYLAKIDPNPADEQNELFYWGHALEQPIADRFALQNGVDVIRGVPINRHPEHEWMVANVDGIINDGNRGVLEIKTVSAFGGRDWGTEGSDEVPLSYVAQCAWYMAVMNYDYAKIAALFGGNDYREFHIDRDPELEAILIERGREFWFNHVTPRVPPAPANDKDVLRLFRRDNGTAIEATDNIADDCMRLKRMRDDAKLILNEAEVLETRIKINLGEAATLAYQGQTLATWKAQQSRRLDTNAFKVAHPDLYEQFLKTSETRVFRLK